MDLTTIFYHTDEFCKLFEKEINVRILTSGHNKRNKRICLELGEKFEDREQDLFGEDEFENMVNKVATIEKELGIYKLSQLTPRI